MLTDPQERLPGPPRWDEQPTSIDTWIERITIYVLSTKKEDRPLLGPNLIGVMDPDGQQYQAAITLKDEDLAAEDGVRVRKEPGKARPTDHRRSRGQRHHVRRGL